MTCKTQQISDLKKICVTTAFTNYLHLIVAEFIYIIGCDRIVI